MNQDETVMTRRKVVIRPLDPSRPITISPRSSTVRYLITIVVATFLAGAIVIPAPPIASAALADGHGAPANCGSPCYTQIHKYYSTSLKRAYAEYDSAGSSSERLAAQARCRSSAGTFQWQTDATPNAPFTQSYRTCSDSYTHSIVDNGFVWWP